MHILLSQGSSRISRFEFLEDFTDASPKRFPASLRAFRSQCVSSAKTFSAKSGSGLQSERNSRRTRSAAPIHLVGTVRQLAPSQLLTYMIAPSKDQDTKATKDLTALNLIATARSLTELDSRRPTQANLRRAISTAYYAMFHSLARTTANMLIGQKHTAAWHQVYRALEHGNARSACLNKRAMQEFPPAIQGFAEKFVSLQKKRHQADYSLEDNYDKKDTLAEIDRAEKAISQLKEANIKHRRGFAAHILFKRRQP